MHENRRGRLLEEFCCMFQLFSVAKLDDCAGIFPEFRSEKQVTHLKRIQIQEPKTALTISSHLYRRTF